ncbi:hypothetical protein PPERSA_09670 [Pseudocohnilembus persalinus]|uniref:Transmembrane protein n=1 Tax=Pseudocohnilembus persalinus TaxID=266149 RepID=A0A0V0R727_PSEPJ|nr:hypothetical protein PPERSA_09670 [Pseudocohnilembus persalinus]|eukprot:KRX10286.1 hypothetical protein PPERSA_09670 [Pseudocohnilembus persalinus]
MGAIVAGAFFYSLQDFIMNLTYTGLLFYFSLKYVKLNDGFKNKQQQIGFFIFFGLYLIFLIFSFVYEILTKTNICSKKHGIFVIIGGIFPAICLLILGSKQTKKMRKAIDNVVENDPSVSMKYIVSKEQQIDNLWELIVVYGIAKFMSLMVVIYFIVDSDQGIGMDDCYFLPKLINQDENYVSFNDKDVNSKKKSKENLNILYDSQKIDNNLDEKLLKTD